MTYTLNVGTPTKKKLNYYKREELELMTTYQLREICREEQIINGVNSPLDKDELVYQIMRFRGLEEQRFITDYSTNEGYEKLEHVLKSAKLSFQSRDIRGCAKLICYEGLSMEYFDHFTIGYDKELVGTNALLVSGDEICAIFQVRAYKDDTDKLYITKSKEMKCNESNMRNYSIYCMDKAQSDLLYRIYHEDLPLLPEHLSFYMVGVLNFEVRTLIETAMPLAIDFGTSNTTAGIYLDDAYFEKIAGDPIAGKLKPNDVNYLYHLNTDNEIVPTFPTVVGVTTIDDKTIGYVFGYEANRLFNMSYMDDGFCVFYDIKRFVSESEKLEEIVDKNGHRTFVKRKELIRVYLEYIIDTAKQRFKCNISQLHISAPVKQKVLFNNLFQDILPTYILQSEDALDEGVAVLYNSISEIIKQNKFESGETYHALIIDCGGGTTDLSSCAFSIESQRVSYKIDIQTAYENGDTDFGGNNLTYRIMQLIKIALAHSFSDIEFMTISDIIDVFDIDLFREVDKNGSADAIYAVIEQEYQRAEQVIPTKFKEYEHKSRSDYYSVKNNFYFLFDMAEKVKKEFYKKTGTQRIALSTTMLNEIATTHIQVSRWKLFVKENESLTVIKDIPTVYMNIYQLNLLLKADIYAIVCKFIGSLYDTGEIGEFAILRLTGQSCKIDIFREALKEFIPGKMIESTKQNGDENSVYELKLICLNGAIKYLKDKKFGFADIRISSGKSSFPYIISAFNHEGVEKQLINGLERHKTCGYISRNMAEVTLKLLLKDPQGNLRYTYSLHVAPKEFTKIDADTIIANYDGKIIQDDIDDIIEKEMKFFVISQESSWGFLVIPIYRLDGGLYSIKERFFSFETEGWLKNFFDGTR